MVDYWLAGHFGRAWLRLHQGLRPALGEMPGECALVARGQPLAAGRLFRAQDFAVRVWWRFGMVSISMIFPLIGIIAVLHLGRAGRNAIADLMILVGCIATVSIAQMGLIRYRSSRIRFYLLKAGLQADEELLPPGAPGLPGRSDFWVTLVIAVAFFAIIFYASTRAGHGG